MAGSGNSVLVRLVLVFIFLMWCAIEVSAGEPIRPIPTEHGQDPLKVALGERLFHDPRLSSDDSVSCAHCHPLVSGGADGRARSLGVGGVEGIIKAPTVYNSGFNLVQFWDGRADSLEAQVAGPLQNPREMASSWPQVLDKLRRDPAYVRLFAELYREGIGIDSVKDAIAAFERSLITPDSPFDRWLLGQETALNDKQKHGYSLFKSYGCVACHQGVNVGGNMYQHMGALGDYFANRGGELTEADMGRFNVTGDAADRHMFKVPSLRLAAINPPYFHDGSAQTLREAVLIMARYQLGRDIAEADVDAIVAFLSTLRGHHPRLAP